MNNTAEPRFKRILLKLSGEALQNRETGQSLDASSIGDVARQIKQVTDLGIEVAIVVGGGNLYRGIAGSKKGIKRANGDQIGMLATVMNGLAIQSVFEEFEIPTRVMTAIRMPAIAEPFFRRAALRHLEKGRVVVFAAGTGNPFFTTDSAAALRASEIDADAVLKATKVDGVYNKDPMEHDDAVRYDALTYQQALDEHLGIMDTAAFSLCMENNIPIIVFNFFNDGEILRVLKGEPVGTLVHK